MAAFTGSFVVAGMIASLGFTLLSLLPRAEGEMGDKLLARLLIAPLCVAALILAVNGVVGHLILARGLQP